MAKSYKLSNDSSETKSRKSKSKKVYVVIIVLLVALGAGGYFGYKYVDNLRNENKRLADPQESAKLETERIKADVSKLIDLPEGESPTIATVVDVEKLKNQAFFAKAQNGDRVLMFPQSKKAVLYRPSTNKIIEVAPINIGEDQKPAATQSAPADQAAGALAQ